jgi:hypothetical protein
MRPNFIYIGTGKAGSTWLFQALQRHPEVYLTPVKETNYFDLNHQRGIDWYEAFFADANARLVGEIAHRYLHYPEVAARIHAALGPVKCLAVFRKPEEFILSWYQFACRNGRFQGTPEEWMSARFDAQSVCYFSMLKPYLDAMGRENLFVGCFDDLRRDPQLFFDQVCHFLKIETRTLGAQGGAAVNAAGKPRWSRLALAVNMASKFLKRHGAQRLIAAVKRQDLVTSLLYKAVPRGEKPHLSEAARATIRAIALPETRMLDAHCGTQFSQRWYGDAEGRA